MSMTKDMWMDAVEAICEGFAAEHLTREEALQSLRRLGLDTDEAETRLNEAIG